MNGLNLENLPIKCFSSLEKKTNTYCDVLVKIIVRLKMTFQNFLFAFIDHNCSQQTLLEEKRNFFWKTMVFIHFEYLYHSTDLTKDQNDLFKSSHLCANKINLFPDHLNISCVQNDYRTKNNTSISCLRKRQCILSWYFMVKFRFLSVISSICFYELVERKRTSANVHEEELRDSIASKTIKQWRSK